jgi:rRNA-processing protein EBP2
VQLTQATERQESSGDLGATEADLFDVAVDDEIKSYKRQKTGEDKSRDNVHARNKKRQYKNEKFGFGGKKRHAKSGDAISSGDVSAISGRKSKYGVQKTKGVKSKTLRHGKMRRKAQAPRK